MMTEESNGTNYNKIARIVSTLSAQGVNIRPLSINKSHQEFTIDKENNSIYLGFDVVKGMKSKTVEEILTLRPFTSFQDFLNKTSADVSSVIGLIKSQAFSELNPLSDIKDEYAWYKADVKRQLNGQNFSFLSREGLWPEGFNEERLLFNFNTYLKKLPFKNGYYELDERAGEFLNKIGYEWFEELDSYEWNKFYKKQLEPVKAWLKEYQEEYLEIVNSYIVDKFKEEKLSFTAAQGEIEAVGLCFSPHELFEFNSANFDKLSEDGEVESVWEKNGRDIPIYKLSTLRGVVIANDKMHGNVTLLTKYGPVDLNYRKEEYAHYAAQISQKKSDGTKKIIEKSWFNRGSWIQVLGRRNGAYFIPKKYKNSKQLYTTYKITGIDYNQLTFQTERSKGIIEEETE
jgi:DNA polymerase-3 subunit alpha